MVVTFGPRSVKLNWLTDLPKTGTLAYFLVVPLFLATGSFYFLLANEDGSVGRAWVFYFRTLDLED